MCPPPPLLWGRSGLCVAPDENVKCIEDEFGVWEYPLRTDCHVLQSQILSALGMEIEKVKITSGQLSPF